MESINYSDLRKNLSRFMDEVSENCNPLLITRRGGSSAVLISLEDFHSYEEMLHLTRSSRNAQRLQEAIEQLRSGGGTERDLVECD